MNIVIGDPSAKICALELEIERLADEVKTAERLISSQRAEIESLDSQLGMASAGAEKDFGGYDELAGAVEKLLDEVERPVGSLNATLPAGARTNASLIALYDIINRNI